jgi:hypothetical protein
MTEQWRCSLCKTINSFDQKEPDICQGCHYDYMSDIDEKIAPVTIKSSKVSFEIVTVAKENTP